MDTHVYGDEPSARLPFRDRVDAGRALAKELGAYAGRTDVVVLALPRGGLPVAHEVARALGAGLDLMIVRKLGFPGQEELAMGAIATGGVLVLNPEVTDWVTPQAVDAVARAEQVELERREQLYRGKRPVPTLTDRIVILVDDGLATGSTMRAAITATRRSSPTRIVVAVPVAPAETVQRLRREADEVVCLETPEPFFAIGPWYRDFRQVSDDEVRELLQSAWDLEDGGPPISQTSSAQNREVVIPAAGVELHGTLTVPPAARGIVVFAHGSGSSRKSPRNRNVAEWLNRAGFGTLLFDLLTEAEEVVDARTRELRFDIDRLSLRLIGTLDWLHERPRIGRLDIGLFGASTGAAAALYAAAERPEIVCAVVSRGGRPDLALEVLPRVRAPTLLIVGSADPSVLELNRQAADALRTVAQLSVVRGATHLFEEPGKLEEVARLASDWFQKHLGAESARARRRRAGPAHDFTR